MAGEVGLPAVVDDSGDGVSGTKWNAAWRDGAEDAINGKVRSATNPTVSPANIIDEVVTARGNDPDLNTRLSRVVDSSGNLVGAVAPSALRNLFVLGNLLGNGTFKQWSRGPAAAPDRWALTGGGSVAQCGVGQTQR